MTGVRVRFAPSPTGYLHIGGARTALFNWLFARHEGGSFILRIEDTDEERSSADFEREMLGDLEWLGLQWDEGPGRDEGGGPYRQSERRDLYSKHAGRLVDSGSAYPCFCTEEELERKRAEMKAAGLAPRYDGTCRALSEDDRRERREEGRPESIRFVVPEGRASSVDDLARGRVEFPAHMVGDFVIMRSNGLPTYNFAAAVDDSEMRITHVIRGVEHLSNTVRQLLIFEALGRKAPEYAHIPLILGSDRAKLSKRHGAPNIRDFRERGYPPEALVNYLAFLGWSTRSGSEILGAEDLVSEFALSRVSDSPSVFDEVKLDWISAGHIRIGGAGRYLDDAIPFFPGIMRERYDRGELSRIFSIVSENLPCFSRLEAETAPFVPGPPEYGGEALGVMCGAEELLDAMAEKLSGLNDWSPGEIRKAVKETGKESDTRGKELYMPLRAAVTGILQGPDLTSILSIRGRDDVVGSIRSALEVISTREG